MNFEEFVRLVATETDRTVNALTAPADVLSAAAKPGGLKMTDFLATIRRQGKPRAVQYGHILGSPASPESIADWRAQRSGYPLPSDLLELVSRINGIHLWANKETSRAYCGLSPVEEWELARIKMYGSGASPTDLDDRYLAISYHQDGAAFVVLDVKSGQY